MRDWSPRPALDRRSLAAAVRSVDWRGVAADLAVGPRTREQATLAVALPVVLAAVTAVGDPTGWFQPAGCVVFFPPYAFAVGGLAVLAVGYARRGFALAALAVYGAWFGTYAADVLSVSAAGVAVDPYADVEAAVFYVAVAAVLAFWPFVAGTVLGALVQVVREYDVVPTPN